MRIDKFLWCVRIYKTRSIAADEIKKNRVSVGNNVVKSSKEIIPGDLIKIRKNQIDYQIKVLEIPKSRVGPKLVSLYIEDKTDKEQYEILKMRNLNQDYYRNRGEGRPTKKDRRSIDDFTGSEPSSDTADDGWDLFFSQNDSEEDEDAV
ncbi:RNA-binding protein [Chryseobacterium sp. 6424]|uniref:RNA-binding S4 domain-containing protein n=1 Tax=Chryseobacterium sp. 6424 TaxID=2039166 RepID=UPI000EFACD4B|nr:RNA-binding S4 domain-containing protein [Chryseobacterium sp. 6424]AYO57222.1 RNA-binding protein [Chryseobacterium sp. 6424]